MRTVVLSVIGSLIVAAVGAAYATERSRIERMENRQASQEASLSTQGQDIAVIKVVVERIERKIDGRTP